MPKQGVVVYPGDIFMLPIGLGWISFGIIWIVLVLTSDTIFLSAFFGAVIAAIGVYIVIGKSFVDAHLRSQTCYGLTDQRAIIIHGGAGQRIMSIPIKRHTDIILHDGSHDTGTITFGRLPWFVLPWYRDIYWCFFGSLRWMPLLSLYRLPARFEFIENAKDVYGKVLTVQEGN